MTTEQILKGNKLIAEFMDIEYDSADETYHFDNWRGIEHLEYHTSWNWLMPVVEKIENITGGMLIGRMFCEIEYQDPIKRDLHFKVRIASGVKINAVHGAVVEFIEWYNQQK